MLQPKSKVFKLKFHLAKVEAANNKVNSRVHAYLMIGTFFVIKTISSCNFKALLNWRKTSLFSDLTCNTKTSWSDTTKLLDCTKTKEYFCVINKGLVVIEFETMGAYIKVGEVSVNLGEILNEKKYRVVNVYPLSKCYDKTAKIKLAVDFVP